MVTKKIKRHILVNVSSYDEKGLVSYTETGEEIPLSAPIPRILKIKKTRGHSPLKGGVCYSPLFLGYSKIKTT